MNFIFSYVNTKIIQACPVFVKLFFSHISIAISNVRAVDVYQRAGQGDLDSNDLENWLRYYLPYGQTAYCACAFLSF